MIYVDNLRERMPCGKWRWNKAAHLFGDTESELHAFASKIGLHRQWFQKSKTVPHYDVTENKRREAIKLGAVVVDENRVQVYPHGANRRAQKEDADMASLQYEGGYSTRLDSVARNMAAVLLSPVAGYRVQRRMP